MNLAEEFKKWTLDRSRTNEELYLAELLIEDGHARWRSIKQCPFVPYDYDAERKRRKQRALNPAYRPRLDQEKLAHTVEAWPELKRLSNNHNDDRPVHDLTALRFFPNLEAVDLRTKLSDLSGLKVLAGLKELKLTDFHLADISGLEGLNCLADLHLHLGWPWPKVDVLGRLPALKTLWYCGNLLVLHEAGCLPELESAYINTFNSYVPLRDLHQLPAMPKAKRLWMDSTTSLEGVERFPALEHFKVRGLYRDLSPLCALERLFDLKLQGERYLDLAPVARLPRLRTLEMEREHGLDLTPLSDAPRLREVKASYCKVLATELASLNAILGWVDVADFLAPKPRPLKPLRFISWKASAPDFEAVKRPEDKLDSRREAFDDDPVLRPTEERWFKGLVEEKLRAFVTPGWGRLSSHYASVWVKIVREREARAIPLMIEEFRPLLAATRFKWEIVFEVELGADLEEDDDDETEKPNREAFNVEQEREDWEEVQTHLRERREYLEREYQLSLQRQQGLPIDPEAFSPELPPSPPPTAEDEAKTIEESDAEEELSCMLFLRGDFLWVHDCDVEDAVLVLRERPEDWHTLPEPPEQRPHPRG